MTRPDMLPSALCTASAPRIGLFRGSMAGLCVPLSTLRRSPHEQLRMTRGRCGSLLLHRKGLAPSTPCRSPGASHNESGYPPTAARKRTSLQVAFGPLPSLQLRCNLASHIAHIASYHGITSEASWHHCALDTVRVPARRSKSNPLKPDI